MRPICYDDNREVVKCRLVAHLCRTEQLTTNEFAKPFNIIIEVLKS